LIKRSINELIDDLSVATRRGSFDVCLGFTLESVDTVHDVQARARALQLDVSDVIENNRGTMVYCRMPDGYLVEVSSSPR